MRVFGIKKQQDKTIFNGFKFVSRIYIAFLVMCFSIFSFYSNITNIVFSKDKIDVFKEDLNQIAFYFRNFDKEVSQFIINLDNVVQDYIK